MLSVVPARLRHPVVCVCALVLLIGCGSPKATPVGSAASVQAPVAAAGISSVATEDGQLTLEVPDGAASAGAQMAIRTLPDAEPHAFSGLAPLAAYDVSVGEQRSFEQPLTLRFGYDPDLLREGIDPAAQLSVAYLDEGTQRWVDAETAVDAAAQQVVVTTDHLTLWSLFGLDEDIVHSSHPNFDIYFSQDLDAPALSENRSGDAIFDFAVLVRSALVRAREGYAGTGGSGLKVPEKSKVYIDNWGADKTAEWGWFSKNIEIPVTYSTLGELQHDAAHELFHAVQNEYVNVGSMVSNRWWMEATADYAAATLGTGNGLSGSLPLKFLTQPLNADDDVHMYQVAQFIRYLVDERGVDFTSLFKASLGSDEGVLQGINAHLNTRGDSLAEAYAEFANEFVFGTAVRRDAVKTDLAADLAAVTGEYTGAGVRVSGMVDVPGPCASSLAAYSVKTGTDGPFGVSLAALEATSGVTVRYAVGGPRGAGDAMWAGMLAQGQPALVEVEDGQTIYFLVTNAAESSGSVTVVIEEPQGETTFESTRTAPMYNGEYTAEVAFTLESSHPFTVVSEQTHYGGEYYFLELKLRRPVSEDDPATFHVTTEVAGLAFADPDSCDRCTPAVREAYWTTPDQVSGSEATITATGAGGPSTRLTYEVILEYTNAEGDVYQRGGAVLVDVRIQH
ncbi:MAG: hypothetical protein ACYCYF_03600 [Anaerolineae bacterium]